MKEPVPDFNWYAARSAKAKVSPRCPIAKAELCPRYYTSRWLLGDVGVATQFSEKDKQVLDKKWEGFQATVREEEASWSKAGEKITLTNFCPEVCYDTFGLFVCFLSQYADEIDSGLAQDRIIKEGGDTTDPHWNWSGFTPRHYLECREYSIFAELSSGRASKGRTVRVGLSPKVRWRVFARDSFTCQYCGRKAPEVVLEVDHRTAVVAGGRDDFENLITACLECNRGKGPASAEKGKG